MTPIPTDPTVDPGQPAAVPKKSVVTVAAAEKAAKAAGFTLVNAGALKSAGVLGEFIKSVGAIHLGRARLALNLERIDRALDFCGEAVKGVDDPDAMIGLLKVQADLIGKSNSAAELLIKSAQQAAEAEATEKGLQLPGFAPGAKVGLAQVNVSVDGKGARVTVRDSGGADDSGFSPDDAEGT